MLLVQARNRETEGNECCFRRTWTRKMKSCQWEQEMDNLWRGKVTAETCRLRCSFGWVEWTDSIEGFIVKAEGINGQDFGVGAPLRTV